MYTYNHKVQGIQFAVHFLVKLCTRLSFSLGIFKIYSWNFKTLIPNDRRILSYKKNKKILMHFCQVYSSIEQTTKSDKCMNQEYFIMINSIFSLTLIMWNKFKIVWITHESTSWNQPVLVSYEESWSWPYVGLKPTTTPLPLPSK